MGNFNGHFIGYGHLDDWEEVASQLEPIYATLISESDLGEHGVRYERVIIQVAQPQGKIVHYVRIPVAAIQWISDTPLTPDHEVRLQHAEQAMQIVNDWLKRRGFVIRDAAIAFPCDYKLLEGHAGCLGYSKEVGYFLSEVENVKEVTA